MKKRYICPFCNGSGITFNITYGTEVKCSHCHNGFISKKHLKEIDLKLTDCKVFNKK